MKPNGLPRNCRLRKTREFNRVYRSGRRLRGDAFAVIYLSNGLQQQRLGISVQRKVGNAVRRNRIKRLVREVFRNNRDLFPSNTDVVITIRPGFAVDSAAEFSRLMAAAAAPQGVSAPVRGE
ncbi:ribonuclease P protein component [Desulfogranum mediterraneum]|uniref:ribonuclease P protein component n=1 Tax=Desulfogranum mediterraneum TaxID=160661 RepID=UPI0004910D41|nr:ribonuclease P protein component [Desulfogranum mediterraneum]